MTTEKIETKEDIKKIIDTSTDYAELYNNAIKVLQEMESSFKSTLKDLSRQEDWDNRKDRLIKRSIFDDDLNTANPVTIFEKKGKDLIEKSKNIAENNRLLNAGIQLAKHVGMNRLDERSKQVITDELWQTRLNAINDFKSDIADGILSNENNVTFDDAILAGELSGDRLFWDRERDKNDFEKQVNIMTLPQLIYGTFNIFEGSGAFTYCYGKLKDKLGNQSLFDYINSLEKNGNQTSEILKYSSLRMLFLRKKVDDLNKWIEDYRGNKQNLLNYIKTNIIKDDSFKTAFLTSIRELEKLPFFAGVVSDLKKTDPNVKNAYESASNFDNVDIFKNRKVDALVLYDDAWHGGGSSFFQPELIGYKNQGFSVITTENNSNYTKYVLKKGSDTITMIQLKIEGKENVDIQDLLRSSINARDFNLFALRGHCYNTDKIACALGGLNVVEEGDILIDGGCWNASKTSDYYKSGVRGQIFAYTSEGRGTSTQAFINKIIAAKSSGKNFYDVLEYYNGIESESGADGYFAFNVERPDSVASKYKLSRSDN